MMQPEQDELYFTFCCWLPPPSSPELEILSRYEAREEQLENLYLIINKSGGIWGISV